LPSAFYSAFNFSKETRVTDFAYEAGGLDFILHLKTQRFRSIKSALPIQLNPQLLLLWGFVGFWFAQRGDIFRVRVPNIQFMALYLVFQKVGVYGIKILESI